VRMAGKKMTAVVLGDDTEVRGDAFVDATGSAGPMAICRKYGYGCSMCNLKCPTYGGRVSIVEQAGVKERAGTRSDGRIGGMGTAVTLAMNSLSGELQQALKKEGFLVVELPNHLRTTDKVAKLAVYPAHLLDKAVLTNIGSGLARMLTGVVPLPVRELRSLPGFEYAAMINPFAGNNGNNIRYVAISPFDASLKVEGLDNLFVAGDKCGLMGITEAIVTGCLAGHNAVRAAAGMELIELPVALASGDMIDYARNHLGEPGAELYVSACHGPFLEKMKNDGQYPADPSEVRQKVAKRGLLNGYGRKIT